MFAANSAFREQAVVVHAGARDSYQVAFGLHEDGLLKSLVTNVWSGGWVRKHYAIDVPDDLVRVSARALACYSLMRLPGGWDLHRRSDYHLSTKARDLAHQSGAALLAYSYYAFEAFKPGPKRPNLRLLFQLHPHPRTVRRLLMEELERVPHAAYSLRQEHEIKLPACAVDELSSEPELADGCITASTYTARTLVENGIDPSRIAVVPYGVDFSRFPARSQMRTGREPFTVMFLGSLGQRKGLSYLLEAVLALGTKQICVKLRGRGLIDQRLLSAYPVAKLDVKTDLRREDIVRDLHSSDLLVLPSITEGFAQVILEAMSCGVPVLATENTCAPDVITNGLDGFCIPIRSTGAIASKLEWAVTNRDTLVEMGIRAAARARQYTWPRFRAQLREAYMAGRRSASAAA